jgi:hypothetical protein
MAKPEPSGSGPADPRRDRVACCLATGKSIQVTAKETGVGARTIYRWSHEPAFVAVVQRYRKRLLDRVLGQLSRAAARAVSTLEKLLGADQVGAVRCRSALGILDQLTKLRNEAEFESRLTDLEARLEQQEDARAAYES